MVITKSELRRYYNSLKKTKTYHLILPLIIIILLIGVSYFSCARDNDYRSYADQGIENRIKKNVLKYQCDNPIFNARCILYHHETQISPGVEVDRGYTNTYGWIDFGEWEEGWYSINASYQGYWSYDTPFWLDQDKELFNYLVIPPPWSA